MDNVSCDTCVAAQVKGLGVVRHGSPCSKGQARELAALHAPRLDDDPHLPQHGETGGVPAALDKDASALENLENELSPRGANLPLTGLPSECDLILEFLAVWPARVSGLCSATDVARDGGGTKLRHSVRVAACITYRFLADVLYRCTDIVPSASGRGLPWLASGRFVDGFRRSHRLPRLAVVASSWRGRGDRNLPVCASLLQCSGGSGFRSDSDECLAR